MAAPAEFPAYKTASVASLIPYARNSRTHSDAQVTKIAASIREFGFLNPIIVSTAAGFIISLALTFTVLPAFGYAVTAPHAWGITLIYTAASLLRGYAVRRAFNANA